jgi:hypothetical protein
VLLGNQPPGIGQLLAELLGLGVLPIGPFPRMGLADIDREELYIPVPVLLLELLQGSHLLPEGRSGEGPEL